MQNVQVAELRKLYKIYQQTQSISELIAGIEAMRSAFGAEAKLAPEKAPKPDAKLLREDLQLICFDILTSN
jgi:hypothetical protein